MLCVCVCVCVFLARLTHARALALRRRTLELEAESSEVRDAWVEALESWLAGGGVVEVREGVKGGTRHDRRARAHQKPEHPTLRPLRHEVRPTEVHYYG